MRRASQHGCWNAGVVHVYKTTCAQYQTLRLVQATGAGAASWAHAHLGEAAMVPHNVDVIKLCQQGHLQTVCRVLLA